MLKVGVCTLAVFAVLLFMALLIHVLLYGTETGQVIDEIIAEKLKGKTMRLIDADALPRHGNRGGLVRWQDIEDAPTIDIVRCADCKYSGAWFGHTMKCKRFNVLIDEKFFCAMGEWVEE